MGLVLKIMAVTQKTDLTNFLREQLIKLLINKYTSLR